MNHTTQLLLVLLAFALPFGRRSSAADKPVKHRILLTEYGKGPSRFVKLDADGKVVLEFMPPSTTVIFQVLSEQSHRRAGVHSGCSGDLGDVNIASVVAGNEDGHLFKLAEMPSKSARSYGQTRRGVG